MIRRHLTCPRYRHAGYPHRTCALPKFVCYLLVNLLITAFELLPRPLLRAQKSDPKVCADAELSQAVHRGERRVDADRLWDIPPTEVYVCVEVKVVLKE